MRNWLKVVLTWLLLMAFCAVSAWAFSPGAMGITSVHWWGWIAALMTVGIAVLCIWQERP